ncbi:MAG: hypothetical protein ABRQ25_11265 [Clostridiaceae bacterium]
MVNTKVIVIGAFLSVIAAVFQLIPALLSEVFVLLTIFSTVPVYIVSRISPKAGIMSYFVASIIIMIASVHEGLFFLCTNGIVGLSLGICRYYTKSRAVIWSLSSVALTITLCVINYGIGIPVFGSVIPGEIAIQLTIIFIFALIYNIFYYYFSGFIFDCLKKNKIY